MPRTRKPIAPTIATPPVADPQTAGAAPPQIDVAAWAHSQRSRYGDELVIAFAMTYGRGTDTESTLAAALDAFSRRSV